MVARGVTAGLLAMLVAAGLSAATPRASLAATCTSASITGGVKAVPSAGDGCEIHHIPSQYAEKKAGVPEACWPVVNRPRARSLQNQDEQ